MSDSQIISKLKFVTQAASTIAILVGCLVLVGSRLDTATFRAGFYDTAFGLSLLVMANVVVFAVLIWRFGLKLNAIAIDRASSEEQLRKSEERYRAFIEQSSEGVWRFELEQPLSPELSCDEQIEHFYKYGYLAECNNVMAQMYGFSSAKEILGLRLGDFVVRSDPNNIEYLRAFICSNYRLNNAESHEVDKFGNLKYFSNSLVGIFENGLLVRAWGSQLDISDRYNAESALRYSEAKFRRLAESNIIGVITSDFSGNIKEANDAFLQTIGYTRSELLAGKVRWLEMTPPEYAPLDERALLELDRTGVCTPFEKEYIRKDGSRVPILLAGALLEGSLDTTICFVLDLSDRVSAEKALRQAEERFRTAAECGSDLIYEWNIANGRLDWYGDIDRHLGYAPGEFPRSVEAWEKIVHPDDRDRVMAALERHLQTREPYFEEYRVERLDGTFRHWTDRGTALWNENGTPYKWIGVNSDITERKRAELQIRSYADRLQALSEASRAFAEASLEFQTVLDTVAQRVAESIGDACIIRLVSEDGQQLNTVAVYHPNPEAIAFLQELLAQENQRPDEGLTARVFQTKQPLLIPVVAQEQLRASIAPQYLPYLERFDLHSILIAPLLVRDRIIGTLGIFRTESGNSYSVNDYVFLQDLGDRAALAIDNARLYKESIDTNRIKDEFLATLSHELRTPLNAMLGWTRLLRSRKFDEATTAKALETIDRNTKSLSQLIEDVLDVSRIITGKLRLNVLPTELVTVIEAAVETVQPAAEAKKISISSLLNRSAGPVLGDPTRLQQVVWNLLSNAVKFTPKGGRVEVRLEIIESQAQIRVSDTGIGISADFLPFVFDRFRQADGTTTRSHGGLGLGLAIVRHLVELQGGTVRAESSGEGKGSAFIVNLPLMAVRTDAQASKQVQAIEGEVSESRPPSLDGLRVLVVDDEADARDLIATMLQQYGADVTAAATASEALEALTRLIPNILVSDIGMPGEDGYALIRKVRTLDADRGGRIPAVALTAYARADDRARALLAGFQLHVSKPVNPAELAVAIANLTGLTERL